jgi:hypothetical protein
MAKISLLITAFQHQLQVLANKQYEKEIKHIQTKKEKVKLPLMIM